VSNAQRYHQKERIDKAERQLLSSSTSQYTHSKVPAYSYHEYQTKLYHVELWCTFIMRPKSLSVRLVSCVNFQYCPCVQSKYCM